MGKTSIFDIAGPIMVGPSSSHTAGACKIGQFARAIFHQTPKKVTFYLHGSFGEVYKGHATDMALLAGVMKFRTSDPRISEAFEIADKKGLKYKFIPKDLGAHCHPNSVKVVMENGSAKMEVTGCSIGGGMVEIKKIDGFNVDIKGTAGKCLSLLACHDTKPQTYKTLCSKLQNLGIELSDIVQTKFKDKLLTIFGTEGHRITLPEVVELEKGTGGVEFIRSLSKLQTQ
ncbi:L-serine ammonia-lyase, iron-sulfur-dependent, subunit beta [Candidatus Peregrinibacteria bacterium]|nr:L-serine ammonia-lyase, iron-sulfur-dependent, subunit beta [Candidatus Peregrinibacteria bacterium]